VVAASLGEPVSSPATDALSTRLDSLEEKLQGLGESLAALPEPVDADALAARIEARVDEKLADLQAASESQADPASMIAELKESLEQQNEALKSELFALAAPQESSQAIDEEALAERVKQEVLSSLPAPEAAPEGDGAGDALAKVQELSGRVDAELSEVMARIEAIPAPADTAALASKLDDLAALQEQIQARLDALEAKPAAPDLSGFVSREELAALRQGILDEMQKAVPAAAARIIREEIQALVREMD